MIRRIWTISNLLSITRIFLIIPVGYCLVSEFPYHRFWAAAIIIVGMATDVLDGFFARWQHQVTDFGKIIDPLADKITIGIYAVLLAFIGSIPLWYLVLVLLRDLLIFFGAVYIRRKKRIVPQSNLAGKIAVNFVALVFFLSTIQVQELEGIRIASLWISVVVLIFSFILYLKRLYIGRDAEVMD